MADNEEMKRKLLAAKLERYNNTAMLDNCQLVFHGDCSPPHTYGNVFGKCNRVHVTDCEIVFIVESGETVAFIKPREKE